MEDRASTLCDVSTPIVSGGADAIDARVDSIARS